MPGLLASLRRPLPSLLAFAAALSLTIWVGCSKDDKKNPMSPAGATTSSFAGWFGNGSESGMLSMTVHTGNLARQLRAPGANSTVFTATGFWTVSGGATDTLNGTFDDATGYVDVSGGGYTLAGVYDTGPPSAVFGTYTGPNGNGKFECKIGAASGADVYCGTYHNDAVTSDGSFIFAIRGSELEGAAIESGHSDAPGFTGTVSGSGTTRTLAISSLVTNGYKLTANGTLDTSTQEVSGRYHIQYNSAPYDSGSWSGQRCNP
ncbi:MAG TPA: hypothetical protein VJQ53_00285 [Candidatus Eisenbacteria bacterium]|nr:hypothetical protein [Candidatus Eisenbacteria bacterium]